jgi:formylglycine-generating enzyme required for sulfatase activity
MQTRTISVAVAAMLLAVGAANADVFNMGGTFNSATGTWTGLASLTMVTVGNPGNAQDTQVMSDGTTGYGAVSYTYNIGEYDVTAGQYCAFLNAVAATDTYGLYNTSMPSTHTGGPGITQSGSSGSYTYSVSSDRANRPMTYVNFWEASRFANWLDNSQPIGAEGSGTTETGTYTLTPTGIANNTITRNPGAKWAVTSENEWYKAAYYSPTLNGGAGGYWPYATLSNSISTAQANYDSSDTTAVGFYPYPSYYATFDQNGNVWDWNESIINGDYRGVRGGSFAYVNGSNEVAAYRAYSPPPWIGNCDVGFRVSEVPEPATLSLLALGGLSLLRRRK